MAAEQTTVRARKFASVFEGSGRHFYSVNSQDGSEWASTMPERFQVTKAAESDGDDGGSSVRDEEAAIGHLLERKRGEYIIYVSISIQFT